MKKQKLDDLRIRISNNLAAATSGYETQSQSGAMPLRNPLWEISSLKIKKGFGVTAPHVSADPGQGYIDYTGPTLY